MDGRIDQRMNAIQWTNGQSIPTFATLYIERRVRRRDGISSIFTHFGHPMFFVIAFRLDRRMEGWTDGWMDGRTDGWMDGWMDERGPTDGRNDYREEITDQRAYLISL